MIGREKRVLLRHYLEQGMSKSALARMLGISRRSVYHWIETGQLDRELERGPPATIRGRRCPRSWTPSSRSLSPRSRRIPSSSAECATFNRRNWEVFGHH